MHPSELPPVAPRPALVPPHATKDWKTWFIVAVVVAACLALVLGSATYMLTNKLSNERATVARTQDALRIAETDVEQTQASLDSAQSDLETTEEQLATCQEAIPQFATVVVLTAKAAKSFINASTASVFSKLSFMQQGSEQLDDALAMSDSAKKLGEACTGDPVQAL